MIDLRDTRRMVERALRDSAPYQPVDGVLPMTKLWRCPADLYDLMVGDNGANGRALLWLREDRRHKEDMRDVLDELGLFGQVQEISALDGQLVGQPHGELHVNGNAALLHFVGVDGEDFAWIKDHNRALQRDYEKVQVYMHFGRWREAVVWYKNVGTGEVWPIGVWPHEPTQERLETKARQVLDAVVRGVRPECTCGRHTF